jgi:hypothetical protein
VGGHVACIDGNSYILSENETRHLGDVTICGRVLNIKMHVKCIVCEMWNGLIQLINLRIAGS